MNRELVLSINTSLSLTSSHSSK